MHAKEDVLLRNSGILLVVKKTDSRKTTEINRTNKTASRKNAYRWNTDKWWQQRNSVTRAIVIGTNYRDRNKELLQIYFKNWNWLETVLSLFPRSDHCCDFPRSGVTIQLICVVFHESAILTTNIQQYRSEALPLPLLSPSLRIQTTPKVIAPQNMIAV